MNCDVNNIDRGFDEAQCPQQFSRQDHKLKLGPVSAEVTINIAPGLDVVSVISTTSAEVLKLKVGA